MLLVDPHDDHDDFQAWSLITSDGVGILCVSTLRQFASHLNTVDGDGRVVATAVAVAMPDVVVLRKLLSTFPDSAAAAGFDGVRAVVFLEYS